MMSGRFELSTPEPCSQDWASMSGELRRRHCESCGSAVHDLAQMTRGEIEVLAMRAAAGEDVCGRITRLADGALVMRDGVRPSGHYSGAVLLSAALAAGIPAAAQVPQANADLVSATAAPKDVGLARISGRLLKPDGTPVDTGLVYLGTPGVGGGLYVVDDRGRFELNVAPGTYDLVVQTGATEAEHVPVVVLHAGEQSFGDLKTEAGRGDLTAETQTTTMGSMVATYGWSWRGRLRHPVLYARYLARRMS